ncbi:hypothetical protein EVAR_19588_1 [Eumeta japonica]|uniref:Uncharacterized protein n=1 Tax=Eumeta variegata TaxID=151549 RepID=A0A4C1UFD5_EUMVA|nr:hypothetical protein EVAR_19588_1 [Eumeta japonica]
MVKALVYRKRSALYGVRAALKVLRVSRAGSLPCMLIFSMALRLNIGLREAAGIYEERPQNEGGYVVADNEHQTSYSHSVSAHALGYTSNMSHSTKRAARLKSFLDRTRSTASPSTSCEDTFRTAFPVYVGEGVREKTFLCFFYLANELF